jgi:hypothetical protein
VFWDSKFFLGSHLFCRAALPVSGASAKLITGGKVGATRPPSESGLSSLLARRSTSSPVYCQPQVHQQTRSTTLQDHHIGGTRWKRMSATKIRSSYVPQRPKRCSNTRKEREHLVSKLPLMGRIRLYASMRQFLSLVWFIFMRGGADNYVVVSPCRLVSGSSGAFGR